MFVILSLLYLLLTNLSARYWSRKGFHRPAEFLLKHRPTGQKKKKPHKTKPVLQASAHLEETSEKVQPFYLCLDTNPFNMLTGTTEVFISAKLFCLKELIWINKNIFLRLAKNRLETLLGMVYLYAMTQFSS